ncbi:glutathione S-transferase family protein [Celeribacter halophilus]|uniref:glutathione S-transferase family protein n=1 Tax=Celeribacter halophilus TaxID=576117 RepID=UPI001C0980D3|nr:glutathione S-transferase family protein [Celeribacter halophilus]MBU2888195.1 glutathione S-transferase family protein [Celeribacter halophilus]MDO6512160.1 glutathione S-transferase family protein [Celeribacter halophilus]
MILHNYDLFENCYRVRLVASCAEVALELINVDAFPGEEEKSPEYLKLNPLGRLPILEDDGHVLRNLLAILMYVAEQDINKRFIPDDAKGRARMMDWLGFACDDLAVAVQARAVALLDAAGDVAELRAQARALFRILDDHLTRQSLRGDNFVAGDVPSLADLALFPAFALSRDFNLDHDEFPALRLWARRIRLLPGFITMPGIPDYH